MSAQDTEQDNKQKTAIYADNAATTPVSESVLSAMLPFFRENWGNPSGLYRKGREARASLESARERIASLLGVLPSEVFFTSGGSEGDNWAIRGTALAARRRDPGKNHIITSKIEHPAVLNTCRALENEGFDVTYLDVDGEGFVSPAALSAAITRRTLLASVMLANNEIGTLEPVAELASAAHERGVPFFTDAVQAAGAVPLDVGVLGVDMLSLSGHKFHAPKGVGILYVKNGTSLDRLVCGGRQERGMRAGTENVAYAVGLSAALEEAVSGLSRMGELSEMRDSLLDKLLLIPGSRLNGPREKRLPGNINISFDGVEGESLCLLLDMEGVAISTGSACSAGSVEISHVLTAIGLDEATARGAVRISLSTENTPEEAERIASAVALSVGRIRELSRASDISEEE